MGFHIIEQREREKSLVNCCWLIVHRLLQLILTFLMNDLFWRMIEHFDNEIDY